MKITDCAHSIVAVVGQRSHVPTLQSLLRQVE